MIVEPNFMVFYHALIFSLNPRLIDRDSNFGMVISNYLIVHDCITFLEHGNAYLCFILILL